MGKIFTSKQFIDKLRHIASLPTTYYSGGNQWSTWNGSRWNFDCVVSIKSILWGWNENKKVLHGGAAYGSNGVPDFTCNGGLNYCSDVSTSFSNLTPGEYLCMKGTIYDHVGIYLGNGKVFEVTTAWGVDGATISDIDKYGNRSKNGARSLKWTYHGKLKWIDYKDGEKTDDKKVNVYYRVKTKKHGWLPEVKNLDDYAGWENSPITDVAIKVDKGRLKYRVHCKAIKNTNGKIIREAEWLPYVTGYNLDDFYNGYAGDGRQIDAIEVYYYTPEDIINTSGYKRAKYRVNSYGWQYDNETSNGQDGYAGVFGKNVVKFQIIIE